MNATTDDDERGDPWGITPEGAFDGLIEPSLPLLAPTDEGEKGEAIPAPTRHRTTRTEVAVMAMYAAKACEPRPEGAPPPPRVTTCLRCESLADMQRRKGGPVPPVAQAEELVVDGSCYRMALCRHCQDFEWSEAWQRKYDVAKKANNISEMKRLTSICMAREKTGRRFLGVWEGRTG